MANTLLFLEQFAVSPNGELFQFFVLTQFQTENRFTLFLELLWRHHQTGGGANAVRRRW
jgi:hypothetical protein